MMKTPPLSFNELIVGMKLKDNEKHECVVRRILKNESVLVEYTWGSVGGYGFLCFDPEHKNFDYVYKA